MLRFYFLTWFQLLIGPGSHILSFLSCVFRRLDVIFDKLCLGRSAVGLIIIADKSH